MLMAGKIRVDDRCRAGCDQDRLGGDDLVVGDQTNGLRPIDDGARLEERHAGLFQIGLIDVVETINLSIFVSDHRCPVEARLANRPAKAACIFKDFGEMRGVDQQLFGHAASNDAGATIAVFFGKRDAGAVERSDARCAHAAGPPAYHEEIVVKGGVGHGSDFF
jgi:hypothetical protein